MAGNVPYGASLPGSIPGLLGFLPASIPCVLQAGGLGGNLIDLLEHVLNDVYCERQLVARRPSQRMNSFVSKKPMGVKKASTACGNNPLFVQTVNLTLKVSGALRGAIGLGDWALINAAVQAQALH